MSNKTFTGEWIPCSERLPETIRRPHADNKYLVSYDYGSVDVLPYADGWNCYYTFDGEFHDEHRIDGVIAWMPAPEPYKEEEDDEQ